MNRNQSAATDRLTSTCTKQQQNPAGCRSHHVLYSTLFLSLTAGHCGFQQTRLALEETVDLSGTIFSGGLIHVLCAGVYFGQQGGACVQGDGAGCNGVQQW